MDDITILLVHGVGHKEADASWSEDWKDSITNGVRVWNPATQLRFETVQYDALFERSDVSAAVVAEAMARLMASGVVHGIGDLFGRRRGVRGFSDPLRWTAGMVAQWAADEDLRARARDAVLQAIQTHQPEIICAHSLGSLICYDLLARNASAAANRTFVSLGSQIGNPFVRSVFGGRIVPLETAKKWYHLYNEEDDVLTAPIRLQDDTFEQITTYFDIPGYTDHDPKEYLGHPNAVDRLWREVSLGRKESETRSRGFWVQAAKKPEYRALLVGINDYPDPENRLDGCVNDVFRMSKTLQLGGWKSEHIRVVLNERATAQGIRERLEWLLDGSEDGQTRLFYYSGHGAQIPNYGENDEVDHVDECLVPYDFDWSPEHAVIDDQFYDLYCQLPYEANFIAVFDCCHSGGMTRNGSSKIRGLNPPDDIRHRVLALDEAGRWAQRELQRPDQTKNLLKKQSDKVAFLGNSGAIKRLGRAVSLWTPRERDYQRARKDFGHHGAYLPVLMQACQEQEFSYEYRQGAASYGAFTYNFTELLRNTKQLSFQELVKAAAEKIGAMGYRQTPALVCPEKKKSEGFPFPGNALKKKSPAKRGRR